MKSTADLSHLSILSNFDQAQIHTEPYPYIVIKNALPEDLYQQLEANFPSEEHVIDGREVKDTWYDYPACRVVKDEQLTELWRNFFRYHVSGSFFREFVEKLGPTLRSLHPDLETSIGKPLEDFGVGMRPGGRGDPLAEGADISMECQFYVNLTRQPRTVRGPHVDRPSELFAGLLYFRRADDDSSGADLAINSAVSESDLYPASGQVLIDELPMEIAPAKVSTVNKVDYAPNTLALFLNSERSIHAVTPRTPTQVPRRHINFCGDITQDLFSLALPARLKYKQKLANAPVLWRLADKI